MRIILRAVRTHPLASRQPLRSIWNIISWQIRSRLRQQLTMPFVDQSVLLARRGMTGLTGNFYFGLHEFEPMAFTLHFLRPDDLFADVGANAGSYSVLAAKAVGAKVIAIEPGARAASAWQANVDLNGVTSRCQLHQIVASDREGECAFSNDADTTNHVLIDGAEASSAFDLMPCQTLDHVFRGAAPAFIKLDVEGHEGKVIRGLAHTLTLPAMKAILVELADDLDPATGESEATRSLRSHGFQPFRYLPFTRRIQRIDGSLPSGNVLFLREPEAVEARLRDAPRFILHAMHCTI